MTKDKLMGEETEALKQLREWGEEMVAQREEARSIARQLMNLMQIYAPNPVSESGRRLLYRAQQLPWMKEPE